MTAHHRSTTSRSALSALASTMPALSGLYLGAIEKSLPAGTAIVCDAQALNHPLAMLHIIHPLAARDAANGEGTEPEMRAKYLRSTGIEDRLVNFNAPLALEAFASAGQEPCIKGLCEISDPDLFMSAMVFALNSARKGRDFLGYRDGRNLVEKRFHKYRDRFVVVYGSAEPTASSNDAIVGDTVTLGGSRMVCKAVD